MDDIHSDFLLVFVYDSNYDTKIETRNICFVYLEDPSDTMNTQLLRSSGNNFEFFITKLNPIRKFIKWYGICALMDLFSQYLMSDLTI